MIDFVFNPPLSKPELNRLFAAAWPQFKEADFSGELEHSLVYIGAFSGQTLVGYVQLAWNGGVHAFLLDPTVYPDFQRQGIGKTLVLKALEVALERGLEWVHVDYEPHLEGFYRSCGFRPTLAGLVRLDKAK